jgi:hypothetical protein
MSDSNTSTDNNATLTDLPSTGAHQPLNTRVTTTPITTTVTTTPFTSVTTTSVSQMASQLSSGCTLAYASTHTEEIENNMYALMARQQAIINEAVSSSQSSSSPQRSVDEKRRILEDALKRIGFTSQSLSSQQLSIEGMRTILQSYLDPEPKAKKKKSVGIILVPPETAVVGIHLPPVTSKVEHLAFREAPSVSAYQVRNEYRRFH